MKVEVPFMLLIPMSQLTAQSSITIQHINFLESGGAI